MEKDINEISEELFQELKKRVPEKNLTAGILKVVEEVGELADLALRAEGGQRKHKQVSKEELRERLTKEICDAIIVLIMIAKWEDIDIISKLKQVMEQEIERWRNEDK